MRAWININNNGVQMSKFIPQNFERFATRSRLPHSMASACGGFEYEADRVSIGIDNKN
jgi:hypothetical protein